jgi:hypothetical protein
MRASNGLPKKRLDLISELHRVLGPHMHFIGFRIAPCLDDREMVGSVYLLQNDIGNQTCILFGRRGLSANGMKPMTAFTWNSSLMSPN